MSHIQLVTQGHRVMTGRHLKHDELQIELPKLNWPLGSSVAVPSQRPETQPIMVWGLSIAQMKVVKPNVGWPHPIFSNLANQSSHPLGQVGDGLVMTHDTSVKFSIRLLLKPWSSWMSFSKWLLVEIMDPQWQAESLPPKGELDEMKVQSSQETELDSWWHWNFLIQLCLKPTQLLDT